VGATAERSHSDEQDSEPASALWHLDILGLLQGAEGNPIAHDSPLYSETVAIRQSYLNCGCKVRPHPIAQTCVTLRHTHQRYG
jgi:hypothetical protein